MSSARAAREVSDFRAERRAEQKLASRPKASDRKRRSSFANGPIAWRCERLASSEATAAAANHFERGQSALRRRRQCRDRARRAIGLVLVEPLLRFSRQRRRHGRRLREREAIRPHVLGRFADLLQAVESHPAMLLYLDNVQSMGADSIAGINQDKGLNENLARETLELHTLGVRSGYSQADVTNFAKVLTGWTWLRPEEPVHGGEFVFVRRFHEPGDQVVLGKRYTEVPALKAAIRVFSQSYSAARWTDLRPWRRSAIRIGSPARRQCVDVGWQAAGA